MTPLREVALSSDVLLPGDVGQAAESVLIDKALMESENGGEKGAGIKRGGGGGGGGGGRGVIDEQEEDVKPGLVSMGSLKKAQQQGKVSAKQRQDRARKERQEVRAVAKRTTAAAASNVKGMSGATAAAAARGGAGGVLLGKAVVNGAGGSSGGGSSGGVGGGGSGGDRLRLFPAGKRVVDTVILVGGATRMPAVRRLLEVTFGVEPRRTVDPDEAVALGAAVQVSG
jgi:hypothetical protein